MMENSMVDAVPCRTCLKLTDKNNTTLIYAISEIIMLCTSVKILEFDGLPPHICDSCHEMAQTAYKFRQLCESSDRELRERLAVEPSQCMELVCKEEESAESTEPFEEVNLVDIIKRKLSVDVNSNDSEENSKANEDALDIKLFKCDFCTASFLYKKKLNMHLSRHRRAMACEVCGKAYRNRLHLAQHMEGHNPKCSHLCDTCGKQFTLKSNLVKHQKIHTGEKPFHCSVCSKNFIEGRDLKTHMITHTLEKSYLCSFCGNKFARKGTLRKHIMRVHTALEFIHPCDLCGKSFKDKEDVARHKTIHTGERQHICKICNKAFNRKSNLTVHERIHSDHRPYVCGICERGFNQKHVLITHMEKSHTTTLSFV